MTDPLDKLIIAVMPPEIKEISDMSIADRIAYLTDVYADITWEITTGAIYDYHPCIQRHKHALQSAARICLSEPDCEAAVNLFNEKAGLFKSADNVIKLRQRIDRIFDFGVAL